MRVSSTDVLLLLPVSSSSSDCPGQVLTGAEKVHAVAAWHRMRPWRDVAPALRRLREEGGVEAFVLANGTVRLQLDLASSSGLGPLFGLLLSSELLGLTKPDPALYRRAMQLVRAARPEECVMVAAHAYDLRAAKGVGMRTVYVRRWSEDRGEDMTRVKGDVDLFVSGEGANDGIGLGEQDGDFGEVVRHIIG